MIDVCHNVILCPSIERYNIYINAVYATFSILLASLLQSLRKQQEALVHYREAVKISPTNFEAIKGNDKVTNYLKMLFLLTTLLKL